MNVGIVGIGFMGMIHYLAWQKVAGARVAAIVSRDQKKLSGDWRGIQGNFGPPGTQMDLTGVRGYRELSDALADKELDLIDICLPPEMHAPGTIAALKAGKHALVEKPISATMADADAMVSAAASSGRTLMIAQVLPFFPEFDFARRAIMEGKYGKLLGGHFRRLISPPTWIPDFYDPLKVGGPVVDLHIHDAHFIRLIAGAPRAVYSRGRMHAGTDVVDFVETQYIYDARVDGQAGPTISATCGVTHQPGRSFTHGFEIHLEKATLLYDFAVIDGQAVLVMPLTVLESAGPVVRPELGGGDPIDAFTHELAETVRAVRSGQPSPLLDGKLARDALHICHCQSESVRKGTIVAVA